MQLMAQGQVAACVPFATKSRIKMTLYKGEAVLAARREVASKLTHALIAALKRPRRVDKPDWAPMQQLSDAGFKSDPISGLPVFDPSACTPALLESVWRSYCGVADTINTKELGGTGAALEGLWAHLLEHAGEAAAATPAARRPTPPSAPAAGRGRKQRRIPLSEGEATDVDEGEGKRRRARRECELGHGVDAPKPMMCGAGEAPAPIGEGEDDGADDGSSDLGADGGEEAAAAVGGLPFSYRPRTRCRASPSNRARYPRPPARVSTAQEAAQWEAYARRRLHWPPLADGCKPAAPVPPSLPSITMKSGVMPVSTIALQIARNSHSCPMQSLKPVGLPPERSRSCAMNCKSPMGVENAEWLAGETQS